MRIEYHNAHGNQLILTLTKEEARDMIGDLAVALTKVNVTDVSHYAEFQTEFENDDDVYRPTKLDIMVEGDKFKTERDGCMPAFACGKPVERMGSIPAGPCDLTEGHEYGCIRRNAHPDYEL